MVRIYLLLLFFFLEQGATKGNAEIRNSLLAKTEECKREGKAKRAILFFPPQESKLRAGRSNN